jgi:DNA adenine methylase
MSGHVGKIMPYGWYGSKFTHLESLYQNFPSGFCHLVELFGGSGVVSLNYSTNQNIIKTVNEINEDITNFFEVVRDHEADLIRALYLTPCSKAEFDRAWAKSGDKIERARRFFIRARQSFLALGQARQSKGWGMCKTSINAKNGELISKWNNSIEELRKVAYLIRQNIQVLNYSYEKAILKLDASCVFFYADPPYEKDSRKTYKDYEFEFTLEDHQQLAWHLHRVKGYAMVSHYECDLYDNLYSDFNKIRLPVKENNLRVGPVQEVIYTNYKPVQNSQLNIFLQ